MDDMQDQIAGGEGQPSGGKPPSERFPSSAEEAPVTSPRGSMPGSLQSLSPIEDTDFEAELEIAGGPAEEEEEELGQQEGALDNTTVEEEALLEALLAPDPDAFDDDEPTDPESARKAHEIEDFTLSMVLDTQGEIVIDRDLMLADDLDLLPDEGDERTAAVGNGSATEDTPAGFYSFVENASGLFRVVFLLAATVLLALVGVATMVVAMGADQFACSFSRTVDTVGVWQIYSENFPVGDCSERAKMVVQAAGLGPKSTRATSSTSAHGHSHEEHGTSGPTTHASLHPLADPKLVNPSIGTAEIVDDPEAALMATPYEEATTPENAKDAGEAEAQLSVEEQADIKYCADAKRVNSVDGWRDYLEHFPQGRCLERAEHFVRTRAPMAGIEQGVLEQRSTNRGPSDFLIDTIVLNDAAVRRCVRVARGRGRQVPQRMGIHFTIHAEGWVSGARLVDDELGETSLDMCIGEQVNLLRFPAWNGDDRTITYTMDLRRHATRPKRRPRPVYEAPEHQHEEAHEDEEHGEEESSGGGH